MNKTSSSYISATPAETRKQESTRILQKHKDRIPVICERDPTTVSNIPDIDKKKYLVPKDMTIGQFIYVIRKRINLQPQQALFLFLDTHILPQSSDLLSHIYEKHVNDDGFLYMHYSGENTFGSTD